MNATRSREMYVLRCRKRQIVCDLTGINNYTNSFFYILLKSSFFIFWMIGDFGDHELNLFPDVLWSVVEYSVVWSIRMRRPHCRCFDRWKSTTKKRSFQLCNDDDLITRWSFSECWHLIDSLQQSHGWSQKMQERRNFFANKRNVKMWKFLQLVFRF